MALLTEKELIIHAFGRNLYILGIFINQTELFLILSIVCLSANWKPTEYVESQLA